MITLNLNRKTLLMLILVVGYAFIEIALRVSILGILATIGVWILLGLLYYDYQRIQKKYEEKYSQH